MRTVVPITALVAVVFVLGLIIGMSGRACADETAVAANQLLVVQVADAVTTRAFVIEQKGFERDPLARPYTHSDAASLAAVVVTNAAARVLFRRAPTVLRILGALDAVCVGNNVRILVK